MDLLERLEPDERRRLLDAAERVAVAPGQVLMRRGEQGGDVFRLESGTLEVVDSRVSPPVVMMTLGPGSLVGEMTWVDRSVRTADVRAAEPGECLRWRGADLDALVEADPRLGRSLYRAVADLVVARSRVLRRIVAAGALGGGVARPADEGVEAEARRLVRGVRSRLMTAEPLARRDEQAARDETRAAMDELCAVVAQAVEHRGAEQRRALGRALAHEVHPYTIRSHLGELALDRPSGHTAEPQAVVHLHAGAAEGDGLLGEEIDAWLLDAPTSRAMRWRGDAAAEALARCAAPAEAGGPPPPVLIVDGADGPLLGRCGALLASARAVTVLETGTDALDRAREALAACGATGFRAGTLDVLELAATGRGPHQPPHGVVLVPALLDYLPDRPAAALLAAARDWLAPGGALVLGSLCETADAPLFRHVLEWPTMRRSAADLEGLVTRAGFAPFRTMRAEDGGAVLLLARRAARDRGTAGRG
ncbi:MAG: cyclic nucleotide-binding domain-containing protein [Alphaproteobacteria bacterium]|nr:cyclic nucleotide-binding domain-containing protein [Alphaproteobacteria bacterium]